MTPNDDRPYWQRHYGITGGPPNRGAWRRLGLAFLVALVLMVLVVVVGALLTS